MALRSFAAGVEIDGFRLEEEMPVAGTAEFWRVSRSGTALPLIMKIPRLERGANPINIVGYETEQMILPKLSGPHVPRFFAAGSLGNPYIVMELIAGSSLKSLLSRLPLTVDETVTLGVKIAAALHDIHRQEVIHLDVKPSNVMLRPSGEAVLIDFGFSHHLRLPDLVAEEFPGPTGTGAYISPEQLVGDRSDPRSDVFALGVMLYFFLTGERPFGDPEGVRAWRRRLYIDPVPPRSRRSDCPAWLQEVILRCLEVNPARRYASAAQLAFDLKHPGQIQLTRRAVDSGERNLFSNITRRLTAKRTPLFPAPVTYHGDEAPIIMAAIDLTSGMEDLAEALRATVRRHLRTRRDGRLTCVNVLKLSRLAVDETDDAEGHNLHLRRLAELQHWARGLPQPAHGITFHVLEAVNPASALLDYARNNHVDHIVIGARGSSALRRHIGSVSSQVVAEAPCSVTVVRVRRSTGAEPVLPATTRCQ